MKRFLINAIILYQYTLSPDHGAMRIFFPYGVCRFYPSCSEYTKLAIERYGAREGCIKGLRQLAHCHPFAKPAEHSL